MDIYANDSLSCRSFGKCHLIALPLRCSRFIFGIANRQLGMPPVTRPVSEYDLKTLE